MIAEAPQVGRPMPHDLEAETSVLGAILLDTSAIGRILDLIRAEDFYRENNGAIYRAALNLYREGEPIDNVTLAAELLKAGTLDRVGGRAHLALLQESVPTAANIEHYAAIVRDKALKRELVKAGHASVTAGLDESESAVESIDKAQAAHFALTRESSGAGLVVVRDDLAPAMDRVHALATGDGSVSGVASGFPDLDRLTNGFKPGQLVIVGAATGMGKTALADQIAVRVAIEDRVPVAIFSLEMSRPELVQRMLCELARVDSQRLERGMIGDDEVRRLTKALGPLGDAPVWVDDCPLLDEMALRLKARQAKARLGVELVVVDYLQLMTSAGRSDGRNRVQEVSMISRGLKAIARELDITVLALAQLSRAPQSRPDKRPVLSDLRESGSIEMDADVVMFIYRDDYYNREKSEKPGIAEIIVAKHRSGPTGTVELLFERQYTRFESIERRRMDMDE